MEDKYVSNDTDMRDSSLFDLYSIMEQVDDTLFLKASCFIFESRSVGL